MINVSAQKSEALVNRALPPKTAGWPFVGALPQLLKDPFGFVMETREELGDVVGRLLPHLRQRSDCALAHRQLDRGVR